MIPLRDTIRSSRFPVLTLLLIGANTAVFLLQAGMGPDRAEAFFHLWGVVPARYSAAEPLAGPGSLVGLALPFLSSQFLHAGWLHLISNMWVLWIFGDNVEDRMGTGRFLLFYLACGTLAGVAHAFSSPASAVPAVGASGAIAGVMGAYLLLYPTARILTVVPLGFYPLFVEVRALVFMAIWFITQLLSGVVAVSQGQAGGVAWWAHVGGFVAGMGLLTFFVRRRSRRPPPPQFT